VSRHPEVTDDLVAALAVHERVCIRPVLRRVTDTHTGDVATVPIPCGSTRERVCPACAGKARRLRMHQCTEGWHLTHDPEPPEPPEEQNEAGAGGRDDSEDQGQDGGMSGSEGEEGAGRRSRSTRRRQDAPDLPKVPMDQRTTGRTFTAPDGTVYRPSMFVTLTLPSYGKVHDGVPVDPASYDYRRAALDALLFPRLLDRFWQNLRRSAGYRVQYFSAVEAQRRLAPHLHAAIRGAIPRAVLKAVVRATYHQVWWPSFDQAVYVHRVPIWDRAVEGYVDPDTGAVLPTWAEALDQLDANLGAEPTHVLRFGTQLDTKGLLAGSADADRAVRYLCKYLTKAIADTYTPDEAPMDPAYEAHIDRLHSEVRWLPCSPRCANWLRHGVQPDQPGPGLVPGSCPSPAHDRENLGLGGRRVLVSRAWTGKTLTDHRADRAAVVRAALQAAGIEAPQARRMAADTLDATGQARYRWDDVPLGERDYQAVVTSMIRQARAWREQYEHAKTTAAAAATGDGGAGPAGGGCGRVFGNHTPADSRSMPHLGSSVAVQGERSESRRDTQRSGVPLTATEETRPSESGWPSRRDVTGSQPELLHEKGAGL
jgi:hypothetical protein